jgi:phenylacetate-CoA ligase
LKTIIAHAYNKVPFYKQFYDQHGIRPNQLRSFDDIHKFPILSKDLARDLPLKERTAFGVDVSRCTIRTTSGSTGVPVSILEDNQSVDFYDAYMLRRLFEYGYRPWKKIFRLTTLQQSSNYPNYERARTGLMKKFYMTRVKRLVISDEIEKYLDIIMVIRPEFIIGPPSYLKMLAKNSRERRITDLSPKVIISCGEILDDATRNFLGSSFDSQVYDGYGCIEIAPLGMAWECREHSGLHVNMDVVFLEFLKDGEPISPGEKGEVVATSLFRFATPMIRYRVGDIVTVSDEVCPCGREMPIIKNIEGKTVDFLKMSDKRMISPYALIHALNPIQGIARYQVVQKKPEKIEITMEKSNKFTQRTLTEIRKECIKLFGHDMQIEMNVINNFSIKRGIKFRIVRSLI